MLTNPKPGTRVQVWYRRQVAPHMPLHGRIVTVITASRRRPRNVLVALDREMYVVPCGNLRKEPT